MSVVLPAAQAAVDDSDQKHRWLEGGAGSKLERHPLLREVMDSAARALTRNLCTLSASPIEVSLSGFETGIVDDLATCAGASSVIAVLQAPAWETAVALRFDRACLSTVVEALFGGMGDDDEPSERDFPSPVETRIAALVAEQVIEALSIAFADILPTSFVLEPTRAKPDLLPLGKPAAPLVIAALCVKTLDRAVTLDVILPQAALLVFGDRMTMAIAKAPPSRNSPWAEQLEAEVGRAAVRLQASLDLPSMRLGDIAALHPGEVLRLAVGAGSAVALTCEGTALFRCVLGQSVGHYTVRLEDNLATASPSPRKDH